MKNALFRIFKVTAVASIFSSALLFTTTPASAYTTDIDHGTAVCYVDVPGRDQKQILVGNGLFENASDKCQNFFSNKQHSSYYIEWFPYKFAGWCANEEGRDSIDQACTQGTPVIVYEDWVNTTSDCVYLYNDIRIPRPPCTRTNNDWVF